MAVGAVTRGRPASVPDGSLAEFARDWNDGALLRVMAEKYGCSLACVSQTAKRLELAQRPRGKKPPDWVPGVPPVSQPDHGDVALVDGAWTPNGHGIVVWAAA